LVMVGHQPTLRRHSAYENLIESTPNIEL
jgi:hypothetical protein